DRGDRRRLVGGHAGRRQYRAIAHPLSPAMPDPGPPRASRRRMLVIGGVLLLLVAALWLWRRHTQEAAPPPRAAPPVPVTTVRVQVQDVPIFRSGVGTV